MMLASGMLIDLTSLRQTGMILFRGKDGKVGHLSMNLPTFELFVSKQLFYIGYVYA